MDYKEKVIALLNSQELSKEQKEKLEKIFPELKESEDEKIRKEILDYIDKATGCKRWVAWLEKQGEKSVIIDIDNMVSKYANTKEDCTNGLPVNCQIRAYRQGINDALRLSLNLEKQGKTNKASYEIAEKENNVNEETNAPTGYGKYVDECLNEAAKHFYSEEEDKYSVADLFYAGVRCGKSWLEKQGEQKNKINSCKFTYEDILALECSMKTAKITKGGDELYKILVPLYNKIHNAYLDEKQGEQKVSYTTLVETGNCGINALVTKELPTNGCNEQKPVNDTDEDISILDKVEPKFKVGDWIVYNRDDYSREIIQVYDIRDGRYYFTDNVHLSWSVKECDEKCHLWTIDDAKEGDVLATDDGNICVFDGTVEDGKYPFAYCGLTRHRFEFYDRRLPFTHDNIHPATKEQQDLLFAKMNEAGYEWDAEKKEVKLIITNGGDFDTENCEQKPQRMVSAEAKEALYDKPAWSEEDSFRTETLISVIKSGGSIRPELRNEFVDWLKSLKERIGG